MSIQTFETAKLLEILRILAPATDDTTTEPINSCVICDGQTISTDDGFFKIQVDLPTEITFKVPLARLLNIIQAIRTKKIDLVLVKTGATKVLSIRDHGKKKDRIVIVCMEDEVEQKEITRSAKDDKIYLNANFAKAIDQMKINADLDGLFPERRGVHLEFTKETMSVGTFCEGLFWIMEVDAYANPSRNKITGEERSGILMPWVVTTLSKLFSKTGKDTATLMFHGEYMNFTFGAGDNFPPIQVLCSPLVNEKPHESELLNTAFVGMVNSVKPIGKYLPLPEKLKDTVALARAATSSTDLSKNFALKVLDEGFTVQKKTMDCELAESFVGEHGCLPFEGSVRHDRLEIILPHIKEIAFAKKGAMLFRGKMGRAFLTVGVGEK